MTEPEPPPPLVPGDRVADRYVVERVLGQGAMGLVVAARHEALDQQVAIKVVAPQGIDFGEATARFLREARSCAKVDSVRVPRVMDLGVLPGGAPYMVMEYLHGADLAAVLEASGPLPVMEAVDYVIEVLDALADAHSVGIVHRDLKPGNLFRVARTDGSQTIKVLDFGISKARDAFGVSLTKTHTMLGSPAYMSPEQIMATKEVDARADIWSVGVVLYELLTGRVPFEGDQIGTLLTLVLTAPIPPLAMARDDIPTGLAAVVHRCLERDLAARYQNVAEVAVALGPFASVAGAALVARIPRALGHGAMTQRNPGLALLLTRDPGEDLRPTLDGSALPGASTLAGAPASIALGSRPRPALPPASDTAVVPEGDGRSENTPRTPRLALVFVAVVVGFAAGWLASALTHARVASLRIGILFDFFSIETGVPRPQGGSTAPLFDREGQRRATVFQACRRRPAVWRRSCTDRSRCSFPACSPELSRTFGAWAEIRRAP